MVPDVGGHAGGYPDPSAPPPPKLGGVDAATYVDHTAGGVDLWKMLWEGPEVVQCETGLYPGGPHPSDRRGAGWPSE